MKHNTKNQELLKHFTKARGNNRDILPRPRSVVFQDKTKYNRQRHKRETKRIEDDE